MSEFFTAWLVASVMAAVLFISPMAEVRAIEARVLKDQARIEDPQSRCVMATSQAFFANDTLSLTTIDVNCCSGIPAGPQCYVEKRTKDYAW